MLIRSEIELSSLLEFINQCPFGIIKAKKTGEILLLNGSGSQLLIPVALEAGLPLDNILDLLGHFDEELRNTIESYEPTHGIICRNSRLGVQFQSIQKELFLSFNIGRIKEDIYQFAFKDVTDIIHAEKHLNEITETNALQSGKLEMATGVLHDIGNAVTGFGSEIAKFAGDLEWRELKDLQKLAALFQQKQGALDTAMGQGKGAALLKFVHALHQSLDDRQQEYKRIAAQLSETTSHVQDILNIQRHYVKGKTKGERAPIQLRSIIDDAIAIQERGLEKRNIRLEKNIPLNLPPIKGDKTKLIQVIVNLLKNATEALDEQSGNDSKVISIELKCLSAHDQSVIELIIKDNGIGFEPNVGKTLFERGTTTKLTGTGFGLHNCQKIIQTHQGTISIESEGVGKGARVSIKLPSIIQETISS